jgi:hypothetical protein
MFRVSPASLQTFIDTPNCVLEDRFQYSTVHIPNYSVMAIFKSSTVWGLLEHTEAGAQRLFDHPVHMDKIAG